MTSSARVVPKLTCFSGISGNWRSISCVHAILHQSQPGRAAAAAAAGGPARPRHVAVLSDAAGPPAAARRLSLETRTTASEISPIAAGVCVCVCVTERISHLTRYGDIYIFFFLRKDLLNSLLDADRVQNLLKATPPGEEGLAELKDAHELVTNIAIHINDVCGGAFCVCFGCCRLCISASLSVSSLLLRDSSLCTSKWGV